MSAARSYKTNAVVLRGRQLGEADRIFTLFTDQRGKLDAVAKGVRRPKSHLSGRLEFGNECVMTMHRGRSLDVIVAADIARAPWSKLVDPDRFAVFSLVAEVVDAFCEPDLPMPDVYALLTGAVAAIAASDEPRSLIPRFSIRLLCALGLDPAVDCCVRCSLDFEGHAWLDPDAGGLICAACRERWRDLIEFDEADLQNVRAVGAAKGSAARATVRATPRVERAIETLLAHHLGRRPKASIR